MSLEARNWACRLGGLAITARAVLMALADHEGKTWPNSRRSRTSLAWPSATCAVGSACRRAGGRGGCWSADHFRKDGGQTSNISASSGSANVSAKASRRAR